MSQVRGAGGPCAVPRSGASLAPLAPVRNPSQFASPAKGEFPAEMSSKIRAPLNGIVGMAELALDPPRKQSELLAARRLG